MSLGVIVSIISVSSLGNSGKCDLVSTFFKVFQLALWKCHLVLSFSIIFREFPGELAGMLLGVNVFKVSKISGNRDPDSSPGNSKFQNLEFPGKLGSREFPRFWNSGNSEWIRRH